MTRIYGAGGGGGGGKGGGGGGQARTPRTERDSLESRQYASVLDLISEGEIEGLADGAKSVFLNNTPLQNPDGSYNFKIEGNTLQYRYGTQDPQTQSYIPLGDGIGNPIPVNVTVRKDTPIVRSITDSNVDAVRVTIAIPQLQFQTNEGDVVGDEVILKIEVQYNGGGFSEVIYDEIRGRTADLYQRDYLINLDGAFPVDIRVTRVNLDSEDVSPNLINAFNWSTYTEIIREKLRYPNSALIALRLDAEQFNSIPSRAYRIRGIKIAIPSNATVDSTNGRLIYSGIWDGTFGAAQWCSDPAWILWDLLTSTRYGFGNHVSASQLDKFAFYAASQYCSALVPDGFGGQEPRFSCNVNIQTAEEAYKLINDLCSVMRTMPYWSTGALTISQDAPADYAYYFTQANVTEEGFSYQGSSLKTRPNVCVVSYLDLNARDIAYEVVEDAEMIAKYGVVKTEVSAFACTSRGQAYRIGEWLLYSERYEGEIVNFTTSVDAGVMVRPGSLIKIADSVRSGERRGGRVVSATTTAVTVDDATGLSSGGVLNVILPDGTVEQRGGATVAGNVITVPTAFSVAPANNAIWLYGTTDVQTSTWRVLSVQEQDGVNYAISAIAYNSSKYDYIERGTPLQRRDITNLNITPAAPTSLVAEEVIYEANSLAKSKLLVSWQPVQQASQYRVEWRYDNNNWNTTFTTSTDYEILDTVPGSYQINVYSIGASLLSSINAATLTRTVIAKSAPPETPTGINLVPNSESTAILSWDRALALDVLLGGKVLIRHSNALSSATWDGAQTVIAAAAGSQTQKQVPLLEGTYLIKFEDDTGNRSATPATVVADLPAPQDRLLVKNHYEDTNYLVFVDDMGTWDSLGNIDTVSSAFPGTKTNLTYDGGLGALTLTDTSLLTGEYVFKDTVDLGGTFDVNLRRNIVTSGYLPSSLWDNQTSLIDSWTDIDGDSVDQVDALMYVRTTKDDPAGTPTWGAWNEMTNALVRGRGLQFKIIARTENAAQNIRVSELGYVMEMQQRVEQSSLQNTTTGGAYAVTFAQPFYEPPAIGITAYTQFVSDLLEITEVTRTGFKLEFKQDGETVSRSFTYTAVGYGKEIIV
jgi:predicted phage tail protein